MPELPEVETVCRTLSPVIVGRSIEHFELFWPRTLAQPDLTAFRASTVGKYINSVSRRAKLIVLRLSDNGYITIHLRMTGELLYSDGDQDADPAGVPYRRAAFLLNEDSRLDFFDIRKFGRIAYYTSSGFEELDRSYGIEPLGSAFTANWLFENLSSRRRQLKPLLLDQTFIAGLGNIYVDEALYKAQLHPLTPSSAVNRSQATALHDAIVLTLESALTHRGTTLRNYRSGLGEAGQNQQRLLIYGKKPGTPCPVCDTPLERLVVGQRGSIFCPTCQPLEISPGTRSR